MGKKLWADAIGGTQFFDSSGDPLAGGFVFTYLPGTTTKVITHQDAAQNIAHTNPIVLDANGRPPSYQIWFQDQVKVVVTSSTDTDDPPSSPLYSIDNLNPAGAGVGGWGTKNANVATKAATYEIVASDDGKMLVATTGTWDFTTSTAVAVLGDGFTVNLRNSGTGVIGFNPVDGLVNGAASIDLHPGQGAHIRCTGSAWYAQLTGDHNWGFVQSQVPTAVAAVDFEMGFDEGYDQLFTINGVYPASAATLVLRFKEVGYISGSGAYRSQIMQGSNTTASAVADSNQTYATIGYTSTAAAAGEAGVGSILFYNPSSASVQTRYTSTVMSSTGTASTNMVIYTGGGEREAAAACTGVRFLWGGGVLFAAAGLITQYRRKATA